MPNVDDHGLEVLKKAARNLDPIPKKDYALQVILVGDEAAGGAILNANVLNFAITLADTEVEVPLPANTKMFVLRSRKIARLRLAFSAGGTSSEWVTIPKGGYWTQSNRLQNTTLFIQSNVSDNTLEVVAYT